MHCARTPPIEGLLETRDPFGKQCLGTVSQRDEGRPAEEVSQRAPDLIWRVHLSAS